eukprot:scaffold181480_cov32-Attheya_sp.AAC.2
MARPTTRRRNPDEEEESAELLPTTSRRGPDEESAELLPHLSWPPPVSPSRSDRIPSAIVYNWYPTSSAQRNWGRIG